MTGETPPVPATRGRPVGSKSKLALKYRVKALADYRKIIDYCLKAAVEGTMSQRQCEAIIRGAKTGAEVFVAEQYMRQIGLHKIEDLEGPGPDPEAIKARERILDMPSIDGSVTRIDGPDALMAPAGDFEDVEDQEEDGEDLW